MSKLMGGFLITVICLAIGGSAFAVNNTDRCTSAIEHILDAESRGELAIAKMLIDAALDDACALQCNEEQREQLQDVRQSVYMAYIIERLVIAKDELVEHGDGFATLDVIARMRAMAKVIGAELEGVDQLIGAAFFAAAFQNIEAAEKADQDGDAKRGVILRKQAREFLQWACAFDPRIKRILKQSAKE